MSSLNFEKIVSSVFPELDQDLVPYVASILEENQKASQDEITDALFPILSGYDVVSEDEIPNRCQQIVNYLKQKQDKKKYSFGRRNNGIDKKNRNLRNSSSPS